MATIDTRSTGVCRNCHEPIIEDRLLDWVHKGKEGSPTTPHSCAGGGVGMYAQPAGECIVVDLITQWTGSTGDLLVRAGDLVVHDGRLVVVTEIHYDQDRSLWVRVGFHGRNALVSFDPADWVAVRRYTVTSDDDVAG